MIEKILNLDTELFIYLNSLHNEHWDTVMILISHKYFWIPLYLFIFGIIIYQFRRKAIRIIATILLTFIATDTISTRVFKRGIERLRPCKVEDLAEIIHTPDGCGGRFGFFSSHASNTFGLAFILFLLYRKKPKWALMLLWAAIVSYSRIYLGKHYPLDIICGAIFGMMVGYIAYIAAIKNHVKAD